MLVALSFLKSKMCRDETKGLLSAEETSEQNEKSYSDREINCHNVSNGWSIPLLAFLIPEWAIIFSLLQNIENGFPSSLLKTQSETGSYFTCNKTDGV
jgi:hypothetical protein